MINIYLGLTVGWHRSKLLPVLDANSVRIPAFRGYGSIAGGGLLKFEMGEKILLEQYLGYANLSAEPDYSNFLLPSSPHGLRFKFHYFESQSIVKLAFQEKRIKPYIGGGIYSGFYLSNEVEKNTVRDQSFDFSFRTRNFGIIINTGVYWEWSKGRQLGVDYRFIRYTNLMIVTSHSQFYDIRKQRHWISLQLYTPIVSRRK